jgi:hypothetical protein
VLHSTPPRNTTNGFGDLPHISPDDDMITVRQKKMGCPGINPYRDPPRWASTSHSCLSVAREIFGEHVGCARIAPSGARIYVGAHRLTELGGARLTARRW